MLLTFSSQNIAKPLRNPEIPLSFPTHRGPLWAPPWHHGPWKRAWLPSALTTSLFISISNIDLWVFWLPSNDSWWDITFCLFEVRHSKVFVIVYTSLYWFSSESHIIDLSSIPSYRCDSCFTEVPQCSANKVTTERTAAVSEAMPQQASKILQKENPHVPEKQQVATSQTTKPKLACPKCVALLVITFINNTTSSILTAYSSFSVCSNQ
jgi:hypothetical protein